MFITFEGTEGVGKSTLITGLANYLKQQGIKVCITREPGGTPLAEEIRATLLQKRLESVDSSCELLAMFAARCQHVNTLIIPKLQQGFWVLCDRFVDSSYAYQCAGRGLPYEPVDILVTQFVKRMPDITFWLDAPVQLGLERAALRAELDRFENEKLAFFQKVHDEFARRAIMYPKRFKRLDATQLPDMVLRDTLTQLHLI